MSDILSSIKVLFDKGIKEISLNELEVSVSSRSAGSVVSPLLTLNKKISFLIARSWLPGGEEIRTKLCGSQDDVRNLMVQGGILSQEEAQKSKFKVDCAPTPNPSGSRYLGKIVEEIDQSSGTILTFYIPNPPRPEPDKVSEEQLQSWLATPVDSEPWEPSKFSEWIPYSC